MSCARLLPGRLPLIRSQLALVLVAGLWSAGLSRADTWPEFRGPTGQGIVSEGRLPTEWSTGKNVAWRQPIRGTGWSSPVVQDGRVYLTTAVALPNSATRDQSLRAL